MAAQVAGELITVTYATPPMEERRKKRKKENPDIYIQICLYQSNFFFCCPQLTADIGIYISISCPFFVIHAFETGNLSLTFTAWDDEMASRGQGV